MKWLKSLFKKSPASYLPPNHIEYTGYSIRLKPEYVNSPEFQEHMKEQCRKIKLPKN